MVRPQRVTVVSSDWQISVLGVMRKQTLHTLRGSQEPWYYSPELQLDPPAIQQDGGGLVVNSCKQRGQQMTPALSLLVPPAPSFPKGLVRLQQHPEVSQLQISLQGPFSVSGSQ